MNEQLYWGDRQMEPIVRDILDDLTDRRGLRQEWEQIDDDIQGEIIEVWNKIVEKHFGPAGGERGGKDEMEKQP